MRRLVQHNGLFLSPCNLNTDTLGAKCVSSSASWAGVCPGNNMSAGKRKTGRTGHGNSWLRSTLVQAGWAAARTKGSYFSAPYHRIAAHRGSKRAILAVAHSILVIIYMMLRDKRTYQDLGAQYFDHRNRQAVADRAVRRLQAPPITTTAFKCRCSSIWRSGQRSCTRR